MYVPGLRRGAYLATVLAVVAVCAAGVWHYSYRQALDALARRGEADLSIASDRLTGQLERYRDVAVLLARHPALSRRDTGPRSAPRVGADADAVLLAALDRTAALNLVYTDPAGVVLARALALPPGAASALQASDMLARARTGALGSAHSPDPGLGTRAYYFAAPRFAPGGGVEGVLTVAVDIDALEQEWRGARPAVFFTDERRQIFMSNRSELLFWQRGDGPALAPPAGAAPSLERRHVGGHEIWRTDLGPYIPGVALHLSRDLPRIGMRAEALIDVAPVRRLAALQAAVVALVGLVVAALLFWATERRRALARDNTLLEQRVAYRTAELSGANAALRREVAEREEAEAALKKAQADLVQAGKLSALGQMSAGISHELNQPLQAISQFAENGAVLLDRGRSDAAAGNLKRIAELAGRMGRIIRNLRAFARQEHGPVRRIDVIEAIETALEMTDARLRRDGITLDWTPPDDPVWAMGGEVRLGQVLVNLVSNAADAMMDRPQQDRRLTVSLTALPRPTVRVRDTGTGLIAPERIFDPFYSTKEVGASEGMGLGLSISYGLVQSFGGTIRGRNGPGGGAEFTVELAPWTRERAA